MFWLVQTLVPICVCVVLPVLIIWIIAQAANNRVNKAAEVAIKALESNSPVDTEKLIDTLKKTEKSPSQVLQLRLLRGCIFTLIGIAALCCYFFNTNFFGIFFFFSCFSFAIGFAYLIVYFVTRKSVESASENKAE